MYHPIFPDNSKQDASTTTAHVKILILLFKKKLMSTLSKIWENTDVCEEQYRYASSLYLVSVLSQHHSIIFDWGISASGNVKKVVDGLNVIENCYMYQLMFTVKIPGYFLLKTDSNAFFHTKKVCQSG